MAYVRFVTPKTDPDSGADSGLFILAYSLSNDSVVSAENRQSLRDILGWFEAHLPVPKRFNRTSSKGYYRRATKGIAWFRDSATEHIAQMQKIRRIAEENGHLVEIIRADRVGYITYEDKVQVIAEPFADTPISA
jgi:hypothetical protein